MSQTDFLISPPNLLSSSFPHLSRGSLHPPGGSSPKPCRHSRRISLTPLRGSTHQQILLARPSRYIQTWPLLTISTTTTPTLVQANGTSCLNYCSRLQTSLILPALPPTVHAQEGGHRMVLPTWRTHVTPLLKHETPMTSNSLHKIKILTRSYKVPSGLTPSYFSELTTPLSESYWLPCRFSNILFTKLAQFTSLRSTQMSFLVRSSLTLSRIILNSPPTLSRPFHCLIFLYFIMYCLLSVSHCSVSPTRTGVFGLCTVKAPLSRKTHGTR